MAKDLEEVSLTVIKGILYDMDKKRVAMIQEDFNDLVNKYSEGKYGIKNYQDILGLIVSKWVLEKSLR